MVDLTSPNPLVMTHFELIAAVTAMFAVMLTGAIGLWRTWRRRPPPQH